MAQGVLVDEGTGAVPLASGLLGGHVIGRTDDGSATGLIRVVPDAFGQAEVGDLGTTVGGQEDVGRLEVAVDDPLHMGGVDGAGEDADGPRGLSDVLRPAIDVGGETASVDEFEGEVREAADLADVVDLDDVGVLEAGEGLGLLVEPRKGDGAGVGPARTILSATRRFKLIWRAL